MGETEMVDTSGLPKRERERERGRQTNTPILSPTLIKIPIVKLPQRGIEPSTVSCMACCGSRSHDSNGTYRPTDFN